MTPPDVLQAVTEAEIGREIIGLVPHWYQAACGPERYSIPIRTHTAYFHNHRRLTPKLRAFLAKIAARTRELPLQYFIQLPSLIDVLLESFAVEWLRLHSSQIEWPKLIKYLEAVARRTSENQPIALNLIIREADGRGDITEANLQKFLDRLASSPFSYLMVDPDLNLIDYGEVEWGQVKNPTTAKFYPEFLHPLHSVTKGTDISAHLTALGDIIIMNGSGLLAARRQRKWKVYDIGTFKNSLSHCLGNHHVGGNLFEVIFELSFRRQGALLVYDPQHRIRGHILNTESILFSGWKNGDAAAGEDCGQALVGPLLEETAIGKRAGSVNHRRRLIEMACADGAVVFDDERLLAVGTLIRSHPSVGNQLGARTTAARSSYLWGAHPIKVSSDGDITVYFRSKNCKAECDAEMHFL